MNNEMYTMMQYWSAVSQSVLARQSFSHFLGKDNFRSSLSDPHLDCCSSTDASSYYVWAMAKVVKSKESRSRPSGFDFYLLFVQLVNTRQIRILRPRFSMTFQIWMGDYC